MKIILKDFNYKGKHFKELDLEMPNIKNVEDIPEDKIVDYVKESLNNFLEEEA